MADLEVVGCFCGGRGRPGFGAYWGLALLNVWIPKTNPHVGTTWPYFTFFLTNYYISHHDWIAFPVDAPWSVSVEEQFYIFIPLVIALGGRRALKWVSVGVIAVAYWAIYRYARVTWTVDNGEWTNSLVMFQFFAGGALLAMGLRGRAPKLAGPVRVGMFAAGVGCWVVTQTVFRVRGWEPFTTVGQALTGWPLVLIGCALFLMAFLGIAAERVPLWLRYLGRISFGLYVFHCLIYMLMFKYGAPLIWKRVPMGWVAHLAVVWLLILVVFWIVVGIAAASYRWFERPFLLLKERFTFVPSRPE